MMKDTRKQLEWFSFYDKKAIEEKMEAMAAQGWLIEQPHESLLALSPYQTEETSFLRDLFSKCIGL